jgi:hypothetical protein
MSGIGGLLGAEVRRFFARRVMRGAFALAIALSTFVLVILTVRSDTPSTSQSSGFVCSQTGSSPQVCAPLVHDHRLKIGNNYSDTVKGTGVAMIFVAFVIGASFIGAEFAAGSLGSQLVFEPRRARVVVVKAVAVAIGLALLAAMALLYIGLLQWAGSSLRGVVHGLDSSWFAARAGDIGRVAAAVALAGVATYAITVVTRRTVAAVAALLVVGYASAIVGALVSWRWVGRYNPASTLIVMALDPSRHADGNSRVLGLQGATLTSCAWAVGLTLVAAVIFARREVR